jgi:hypothetical protein
MAVGTQEGFSRDPVILKLKLMADAVARLGEQYSVTLGYALYEFMVVGIFKAGLKRIVIDVCDRELCLYFINVHGFQLQVYHGPGGILRESLIDFDCDFISRSKYAIDEMILQDLIS